MAVRKRQVTFTENDIPKADIFSARGAEFVIPGATSSGIPFREKLIKANLLQDFKWSQIKSSFTKFWSKFRTRVWFMFVEALWIPSYRPEWGKYKTWKYTYGGKRQKTRTKKKISNSKNREISSDSSISQNSNEIRWRISARKVCRRETIDTILEQRQFKQASEVKLAPHDTTGCEIIRFNISGMIYETQQRTVNEFPDTLLGNPTKLRKYWDPTRNEYFFDRHRRSFEAILYYYQTRGTLIRPQDISLPVFEDEINFYELGSNVIFDFLRDEGMMNKDDLAKPLPKNLLLRKLWFLIEYPESSTQAQLVALFSVFVVLLSTLTFCIETLPIFNKPNDLKVSKLKDPFFLCESVCVMWFSLELIIRLACCPAKGTFLMDPMNIVDVISIIPFYVTVISSLDREKQPTVDSSSKRLDASSTLVTLRIFRLFRVFRIFKLSRHSAGLQVLGKTLRASVRELGLLVFFLLICVVIFSSLVYFAEVYEGSTEFSSIPDGFWWGIVTMTSLGYGDKVPKTIAGRIICSFCAIAAVLALSLPIPVFVSNFNYFYQRETQEQGRRDMETTHHVIGCSYLPECPVLMARDGDTFTPQTAESEEARQKMKRKTRQSLRSAPPVLGRSAMPNSDKKKVSTKETARKPKVQKRVTGSQSARKPFL